MRICNHSNQGYWEGKLFGEDFQTVFRDVKRRGRLGAAVGERHPGVAQRKNRSDELPPFCPRRFVMVVTRARDRNYRLHCSVNFQGFMEGGAEEGQRAANEILAGYEAAFSPEKLEKLLKPDDRLCHG